jgi:hypothetical protein
VDWATRSRRAISLPQTPPARHRMRISLSQLDPAQSAEVEEASRILRRTRAARALPLADITSRAAETA